MGLRSGHEITLGLITGEEKVTFEDATYDIYDPITGEKLMLADRRKIFYLFQYVYFIHPDIVAKQPIKHPNYVRYAKYKSAKPGLNVAPNNVKARDAFTQYTKVNLNDTHNPKNRRLYGYTVAHIYGKPEDPLFFTAGYNLALMLDTIAKFSDPQSTDDLFYWALTSAAYSLHRSSIEAVKSSNENMEIGIYYPSGRLIEHSFPFWFKLNTLRPVANRSENESFYEVVQLDLMGRE